MNQARRVGKLFAKEKIDRIYSSDLLRAHWTGREVPFQISKSSQDSIFTPHRTDIQL